MTIKVTWQDAELEPKVAPNPKYPDGIDIDASAGAQWKCKVAVPYPAKRIGSYLLECDICGLKVAITTAGRRDDPRSVTMACKRKMQA